MEEYVQNEFWDMIYNEYGVQDEFDVLSEKVENIIYPAEGIIIFITKEFYDRGNDGYL
jgi:hypothetical protein|tara:strand:+ start:3051 stop:3224 length:174 start_codon:yes stop_codon:yes gene_type:complete